ncbi:glycoside hydrolase family 10 protein [Bacteroidota bacterium]
MKKILFAAFIYILIPLSNIYPQIIRETRGVWLTTNFRLDWPPKSYDADVQKKSLVEILDNIKKKKLNTVYFQVRSLGTILYKSSFDPFSSYITGEVGGKASYDPLEFALYHAHRKGLELHAWINVIRCFHGEDTFIFNNPLHISKRKPEWVVEYIENGKSTYWLDPGLPEVRVYLVELILEIVRNYDIDGIHLDFLRYPGKNFDDNNSYNVYGKGMPKDDWRRNNLTMIVSELSARIKAVKPYVKIGVTPIGIYENRRGANGLQGYHSVYQDSREWLKRKLIDYAVPQIYWPINGKPKFEVLADDWINNSYGRNIVLGIAAYKPEVMVQLEDIIALSREINSQGVSFFRYSNIKDYDFHSFNFRTYPSEMTWIDDTQPGSPIDLAYNILENNPLKLSLNWDIPEYSKEQNRISYYSLYSLPGDSSSCDPENLFEIIDAGSKSITLAIAKPKRVEYHFAVKSIDKSWNESKNSSNIVSITIPELESLLKKYSLFNKPVLIKRKDGVVKVLLFANKDEKVEISAEGNNVEKLIFNRELFFGNNILSLNSGFERYEVMKIKYKNTGREVSLNL